MCCYHKKQYVLEVALDGNYELVSRSLDSFKIVEIKAIKIQCPRSRQTYYKVYERFVQDRDNVSVPSKTLAERRKSCAAAI